MQDEALRTASTLFAAGQATAAAVALTGRRRGSAVVAAGVAGVILLLWVAIADQPPAPWEILLMAGEALGLLTLVVVAFRPNRPLFWLLFWLAWTITAPIPFLLVYSAFFFRMW